MKRAGTFALYPTLIKTGRLLHKMGFVDSQTHRNVETGAKKNGLSPKLATNKNSTISAQSL